MKVALQEASRSQNQMQALNISLTAQQSRLAQVSARLDTTEEDLQQAIEPDSGSGDGDRNRPERDAAQYLVEERGQLAEMVKGSVKQADQAQARENNARVRRDELMNAFRAEEARWLQLVAKLEEIVKR